VRSFAIVALLASAAHAEPVARLGMVGGYDESAPAHQEDGFIAAGGYRAGAFTATLEGSLVDYSGSGAFTGGANRVGALAQLRIVSARCSDRCPHVDLDAGVGYRWLHWEPHEYVSYGLYDHPSLTREGAELAIGVSATFGWHFSLHYVLFDPRAPPSFACRGVCMAPPTDPSSAVLLEAGWAFGGS